MRPVVLGLTLILVGQGAWAEAPATSLRPLPRPDIAAAARPEAVEPSAAAAAIPRPRRRPEALTAAGPALPPPAALAPAPGMLPQTPRPRQRPEGLTAVPEANLAAAPQPEPGRAPGKRKNKAIAKGSVCGDPEIRGEALAPIKGKVKGCGLDQPVRVTSISGIRLNQPATFSCDTAAALKTWIERAMRPAMGRAEVVELRIAASYVCRPRNNKKGAKISEHGRGRAVDVAGFVFADGTEWSVLQNYNKQVRRAHKNACGIFSTTLGPGSDGFHEDHLHFDIAANRNPYCR